MPKKAMKKGLMSSGVFIECGIPLQLRHRVCVPRRSRNLSYLFSPPHRTEDRKQKATDALLSKRQAGRLPYSFARRFAFFRFFTGPNGGGGDKQTDGDDKECVVEGQMKASRRTSNLIAQYTCFRAVAGPKPLLKKVCCKVCDARLPHVSITGDCFFNA
jgi:hypothetical protein